MEEFEKITGNFALSNQPPHIYWSSPKCVLMLKDRIFGLNLVSEYVLFKFKNLLVVQNFKIAFNSVVAIISTGQEMGSLEKRCFRLNVFVWLSL